jgi:hypothetical protein
VSAPFRGYLDGVIAPIAVAWGVAA